MSRIRVGATVLRVPLHLGMTSFAPFIKDGLQEVGIGHIITELPPIGGGPVPQGLGRLLDGLLVPNVEP